MPQDKPLLVTGASGNLGRRIVELLLERGAGPIIATTRSPEKLAEFAAKGVEVRAANYDDPASMKKAFAGVGRMVLISTDKLDGTPARLTHQRAAVRAAAEAGVGHIVYPGYLACAPTPQPTIAGDHFWTEQAIVATGLDWTFVREAIYTETLLWWLPYAVKSGEIQSVAGDGGLNYVSRNDIAAVAATVLTSGDGHRVLGVTGPEPVTRDALAALATEITGKPVRHVRVTPEERRKQQLAAGVPPFFADANVLFEKETAEGYLAVTTSTVEEFGGKKPLSVREFLTAHRAVLTGA